MTDFYEDDDPVEDLLAVYGAGEKQTTKCPHRDTWFSREICAEPCGMMHTYCTDCGKMMEKCATILRAKPFGDKRRAALEKAKRLLEYVIRELDSLE